MESVQIVDVCKDTGTYKLNEEALGEVLLRPNVADCPVAVVSVAGAYRGGKSFLLDYLLRYLLAKPEAQEDGTWIGESEEPLQGFNWRSGSEPDTQGLSLLSQPVRVTLPSGKTAAVLLLDTQGSFDWASSMRQCSIVFALSTLLSSVQIYNVARDIRADELYHLQLFTEYTRLALKKGEESPLQCLQIVVRDWSCAYDHPIGAGGGQQLLQARCEAIAEGSEIPQLWRDISKSFNKVQCFLMPHPGLAALDQDFDGRRGALNEDFLSSLKELAPSILDPENLTLKLAGGEPLTCRQLYEYFKTYLEIFNSNQMPTPLTILQATAEAGISASEVAARVQYREIMEETCGPYKKSISRESLRFCHEYARDTSLQAFKERRILADNKQVERRLITLTQDLNNELANYKKLNESKIMEGIDQASSVYESQFEAFGGPDQMCFHPKDLEMQHRKALDDAKMSFDNTRVVDENLNQDDDKDLNTLIKRISNRFRELTKLNEANNETAVHQCTAAFVTEIDKLVTAEQPCMSPGLLIECLDTATAHAIRSFQSKRSLQSDTISDFYKDKLIEATDNCRLRYIATNKEKNEMLITRALDVYSQEMQRECQLENLNPVKYIQVSWNIDEIHENCKRIALNTFRIHRKSRDRYLNVDDQFLNTLKQAMEMKRNYFQKQIDQYLAILVSGGSFALAWLGFGIGTRFLR